MNKKEKNNTQRRSSLRTKKSDSRESKWITHTVKVVRIKHTETSNRSNGNTTLRGWRDDAENRNSQETAVKDSTFRTVTSHDATVKT